MSSTKGKKRSTYDGGTSSLYDLCISGFPLRSRMAIKDAIAKNDYGELPYRARLINDKLCEPQLAWPFFCAVRSGAFDIYQGV